MIRRCLFLILMLFFLMGGYLAHAQVRNTDIVLSISPQYPGPNQNVTASLNSYVTQLEKANISWLVNNQEILSGIGKKSTSFTTGNSGSDTILSVIINTVDGQNISKTITITPSGLDILWEAYDVYVPPFYKGKALVPNQGKFKVVAIPNLINQGKTVGAGNLSYLWEKDGKVQSDSSGWGKSYFIFQHSYLDKENTVEVKASSVTGNTNALGNIKLRTSTPKILFYENDNLVGPKREKAINNNLRIDLSGKIILAEPYFFSPKNINDSNLTFDWMINRKNTKTPNQKNMLSIKPEAGQSGRATIGVKITNTNTLFQEAEKQINVEF